MESRELQEALPDAPAVPVRITRVVTGHSEDGRSIFVQEGPPPRSDPYRAIPGMVSRLVWATEANVSLPFDGTDPTPSVKSIVPSVSSTRFLVVTFPPDSVFMAKDFDVEAAVAENHAISPGLAERFEPDGMHTTPTVDYGVVLDGEIWLELDDGETRHLRQHDVIVQHGTRHAWRNKSERPATLSFVLIGVRIAR
ncbi:cupin 2 domain-containing protein [Caballeronia arvi]|uniref:Cupin 2 domain-containing protein n=1 Tax=Caballeronia arvi TaxID=1777135 RepID=A0A158J2W4_9BURK|nr:cupin domain-containing protein [Caballeronia arvi]SAL63197.1 cupin 2 domain-containing protein [Caballeronia arvi]